MPSIHLLNMQFPITFFDNIDLFINIGKEKKRKDKGSSVKTNRPMLSMENCIFNKCDIKLSHFRIIYFDISKNIFLILYIS